jgi:hypothetical protein
VNGASYAFYIDTGATTNFTIDGNLLKFDASGGGLADFWGVLAQAVASTTVSNNQLQPVTAPVHELVNGTGVIMFNNRMLDGSLIPGLGQ